MCGILGVVVKNPESARKALWTIYDNQKARGQQGYGYALLRNGIVTRERGQKVDVLFNKERFVAPLREGDVLIAHNRYPTSTPNVEEANHPVKGCEKVWLVHNGQVSNDEVLREELVKQGHSFETACKELTSCVIGTTGKTYETLSKSEEVITDSEVLAHLLEGGDVKRLDKALGSFAIAWLQPTPLDAMPKVWLYRKSNPVEVFKDAEGNTYFASELPEKGFEDVTTLKEGEHGFIDATGYVVVTEGKSESRHYGQTSHVFNGGYPCGSHTTQESISERAVVQDWGDEIEKDIKNLLAKGIHAPTKGFQKGYYFHGNPDKLAGKLGKLVKKHAGITKNKSAVERNEGLARPCSTNCGEQSTLYCFSCGALYCEWCWEDNERECFECRYSGSGILSSGQDYAEQVELWRQPKDNEGLGVD